MEHQQQQQQQRLHGYTFTLCTAGGVYVCYSSSPLLATYYGSVALRAFILHCDFCHDSYLYLLFVLWVWFLIYKPL